MLRRAFLPVTTLALLGAAACAPAPDGTGAAALADAFADAERCYRNTVRAEPDQDSVVTACTRALDSGRLDVAERAGTLVNRGVARERQGDDDGAFQDFDEAVRLKPDYANAFYNRGNTYEQMGGLERAARDYRKALQLASKHPKAKVHLLHIEGLRRSWDQRRRSAAPGLASSVA